MIPYLKRPRILNVLLPSRRLSRTIDLSEPHLWYNNARSIRRKIVCHVGVTNSGKTYNALNALTYAKSGLYCGPLRLLAWEVAEKLRQKGVLCNLLTGQEKDFIDGGTHVSCTVEMADLKNKFDVAVIDEAQLLGDESRGWAWTQAFLGVQAKEVHLCGSASMLPIVQDLCSLTNDEISVKHYSRLTPLSVMGRALSSFKNIQKGDCVIGFGRQGLYETKKEIERSNPGLRCCVIYGGLPPDARRQQAQLFSDPDSEYNVLVASDAIGMGLNLAIKRIVFSTIEKFDGRRRRHLFPMEMKQIAGRAGRFGTAYEDGLVTCLRKEDLRVIRQGLDTLDKPIKKAGLFPSQEQLELLGVLVDYRVDDKIMRAFWEDKYSREWDTLDVAHGGVGGYENDIDGERTDSTNSFSYGQGMDTATITKRFGTVKEFARQLELFLTTSDEHKEFAERVFQKMERARRSTHVGREVYNYDSVSEAVLPLNSENSSSDLVDNSVDAGNSLLQDPQQQPYSHRHRAIEEGYTGRTPETISFSKLLSLFQRRAEMGDSGRYFLCDLAEKTAMAEAIDDIPLSFRNRYVFCMAPVDSDNDEVMSKFRRFASDFSRNGRVILYETVANKRVPRTPLELLGIETQHKIFDLYMWLSHRFPMAFVDVEKAQLESKQCGHLVDAALQSFGAEKMRNKSNRRQQRQTILLDSDEEDSDGNSDNSTVDFDPLYEQEVQREMDRFTGRSGSSSNSNSNSPSGFGEKRGRGYGHGNGSGGYGNSEYSRGKSKKRSTDSGRRRAKV